MHFMVTTISLEGKKNVNFMESQSYEDLVKRLQKDKVITLKITPIPHFLSPFVPKAGKKVSPDEVIEMIENLHLVIKSGLPLYQGIMDLADDTDNKRFKDMLLSVASDINNGKSLSMAFEPYKDIMGTMIINLVQIGEDTGQLELTLKRGASFLRRTVALKKKAKSALIYPSFALFAVMGAMLVWMIYVLPQMTTLFKEMDIKLPPLTLFMMALSDFLTNYIVYMLLGIVIFFIIFKIAHKKNERVRWYMDKLLLKIPAIKEIISSFNIAFISEYLKLAIVSGIPIYSALDTLGKNIGNELFKKALSDATYDISRGSQLSAAFLKTKMFTTFMIRMMGVGESSGTLENQLNLVSEHYYEKVDNYAENIGKIIEPVVLIVVGGFMALVMIGLMGPMYDLISKVE
ncbi:MAG: type II secretion system F family protein [Sulfurimonas sp.]|uniref:type II secretion system F family protein n=1 Tax=Sulfurimonas sp. TaxID=2022749 RepID=UPI002621F106|nr:type II secretion system F family protein [Sulfurimonas sp.]MDD5373557.1 type II secretion system F family protein [Sulfurimonas sp.]